MDIPISLSVKLKRLKINMEFQKKFFTYKVSITKQSGLFQIKKRKEQICQTMKKYMSYG